MLLWILFAAGLTVAASTLSASLVAAIPPALRDRLQPGLLSYATGALLGAAWLELIPEAAAALPPPVVGTTCLASIAAFFVLEKVVLWRHGRHDARSPARAPAGVLILLGDGLHNLIDGMILAAAFLADPWIGIAATVAVVAHELPQEVGDAAILLRAGYSPRATTALNALSASCSVLGAVCAFLWLSASEVAGPYLLAIAGASFLYIAGADLVPMLHQYRGRWASALQVVLLLAGIFTAELVEMFHGTLTS